MTTDWSPEWRVCALVPTYDNPRSVRTVVERIHDHDLPVILVDDGSDVAGRTACSEIGSVGLATVIHRERNGGKGAAVLDGLRAARRLGFSHAMQIDADGQHDLTQISTFLAAAERRPEALLLGVPLFDASAPRFRTLARRLTNFFVAMEVGGRGIIADAMIGFRVYPIERTLSVRPRCRRMAFDVEILVLLARTGVPIVNLPVAVRVLGPEDGGVSHFRMFGDNLQLSWLHTRLCTTGVATWLRRQFLPRSRSTGS